jgi:anti-anti-sigma factor
VLAKPPPQPFSSDIELPAAGAPADRTGRELSIRASRQGLLKILHMRGALHAGTAVTAEAQILSTIVLTPRPLHLVLDLSEIAHIDAAGIGLLAKTRFAVHAARGTLHLVAPAGSPAQFALLAGVSHSGQDQVDDISDIRLDR